MELSTIWFCLVGLLFTGYVILDGFDLGVGALHLLTKTDEERRIMINSIGPVWDGNEVWLVTGGGALFAAFPAVYATVFSGFYDIFMLLLVGLIFRAIAIEFRSKEPWGWWRKTWDIGFAVGSVLSSFIIGVIMGNAAKGVPLSLTFEYVGEFDRLFTVYPLVMGVTTVALFMMHASIYLTMKTEGEMHDKVREWVTPCIGFFLGCYLALNILTFKYCPHIVKAIFERPHIWFIFAADVIILLNIPFLIRKGKDFKAFLFSCMTIGLMMIMYGLSVYPHLLFSDPLLNSLTVTNAASTDKTLKIMLIIAILGVPLVLAYSASIYWIFRGKVKLTEHSY